MEQPGGRDADIAAPGEAIDREYDRAFAGLQTANRSLC